MRGFARGGDEAHDIVLHGRRQMRRHRRGARLRDLGRMDRGHTARDLARRLALDEVEDPPFHGCVGQRHLDLQHEAVELRLGQRERALVLDRVLRRHHHERLGQLVGDSRRRHLVLCHGFQQSRLHLGRGAVDLVDEHQRVEDRPLDIFERALVGPKHRGTGEVGRHQVRRALDARERCVQPLREQLDRAGLGKPRRAFDEQVTAGEKPDQQALGEHRAADQPRFEKGFEVLEALLNVRQASFDSVVLDGIKTGVGPHVASGSLERCQSFPRRGRRLR